MFITELGNKINELLLDKVDFTDDRIKNLINSYNEDDWKSYVIKHDSKYNKIKVFETELFDIYVIVWNANQQSKVHNHSSNGCWLKILEGKVEEKIYNDKFELLKYNIQNRGEISFIKDDIGYHSIKNINNYISVSLHIYNPPNFTITNFL
jgi:cysteine dioxygenase